MSRIEKLRRQLGSLSWRKFANRQGASAFATLTGMLLILAVVFLVDFLFELPAPQRIVAFVIAGLAAVRVVWGWGPSLRGNQVSPTQTALQLKEQRANDLVAALQFARPQDASSGSTELKNAVIQQVEEAPINVFAEFNWSRITNAFLTFAVLLGLSAAATALFPTHASVFLNRLALGERIYPKRTEINALAVNDITVLDRVAGEPVAPTAARCPQGKPLRLQLRTSGAWAEDGALQLRSSRTGAERVVELVNLTVAERVSILRKALIDITRADDGALETLTLAKRSLANAAIDIPGVDVQELADQGEWETLGKAITSRIVRLNDAPVDAIWICELSRLIEPASYRVSVGDSRTAVGRLDVAEIPVVELQTKITAPAYAGDAVPSPASSARQFTVLEGSSVAMTVRSLTENPLGKAWISLWEGDEIDPIVIQLEPDEQRRNWTSRDAAALQAVKNNLRYEVMAEDETGFSIETPQRGVIRIRPDRAPTARIQSVHRVVLPNAAPVVTYVANDDFGVAKVVLRAQVERVAAEVEPLAPGVSGEQNETADATQDESQRFVIIDQLSTQTGLPINGRYTLDLSSLAVAKGDRLRLTAEVLDGRGQGDGVWASSESIYMEVSDESGVLNAISEPDERSEQRLDDLIRRQLGIGDEP